MVQEETWLHFKEGNMDSLERFLHGLVPNHPVCVEIAGGHWNVEACQLLANAPADMDFRNISLRGADIGDEGIEILAASPILSSVHCLCIEWCGITDAGVTHLANSPYVRSLNILALCNREGGTRGVPNQIGDAGARALAASPYLGNLEYLDLWTTNVGDVGVEALAASPNLRRLLQLAVWATRLTPEGAERAKARAWERTKRRASPICSCSVKTDYDERDVTYYGGDLYS